MRTGNKSRNPRKPARSSKRKSKDSSSGKRLPAKCQSVVTALSESEERFRILFDGAIDGLCVADTATKHLTFCNEAFAAMLGYTRAEVSRLRVQDIHPRESRVRVCEAFDQQASGEIIKTRELPVLRKDGKVIYCDINSAPIVLQGKKCLLGIFRDVTERLGSEAALRTSERRLRTVIEASPMGMHFYELRADNELIFLGANPAAKLILGLDHASLVGKTIEQAFPGLAGTDIPAHYRDVALHGGVWRAEQVDYDRDAIKGAFEVVAFQTEPRKMVALFNEITKRKVAEKQLAEERERLDVTLRSIGDGVITTDTAGRVVMMNAVAEQLTGWSGEQARGKPLAEVFNVVNQLTHETCRSPVEKVLLTGRAVELANHTALISRDGTERVVADSAAPIRDHSNMIVGVVLVFRDMTEKERLLAASQRTQKLESLGVLAGGIAHDFNNLLAGIFAYLDLAAMSSRDPAVSRNIDAALKTMARARSLTQQLLTFAKGGLPIKKVSNQFTFVREAAEFALSGSNVVCTCVIPADLWFCEFDVNQVSQVVDNIVINGQHAMPAGGSIAIDVGNVDVEPGAVPDLPAGRYVRIRISDHGVGIPRDILPRIFDPFFTTKQKGSGLGLAASFSIMSHHKGTITVSSEPGRGSTFQVYLSATTAGQGVAAGEPQKLEVGSGRILMMDDEEYLLDSVGTMLQRIGYSLSCAREGGEAIAIFRAEHGGKCPFAAVIVDLTVRGGLGGKDTIAGIRAIDPKVPIFVASGYASDPVMSNPAAYGATASIAKPFTRFELSSLLKKHLQSANTKTVK